MKEVNYVQKRENRGINLKCVTNQINVNAEVNLVLTNPCSLHKSLHGFIRVSYSLIQKTKGRHDLAIFWVHWIHWSFI